MHNADRLHAEYGVNKSNSLDIKYKLKNKYHMHEGIIKQ